MRNEKSGVLLTAVMVIMFFTSCASLAKNKAELAVSHKEFETYTTMTETIDGATVKKEFLLYKKYNGFDGTIESVYIMASYLTDTPSRIDYSVNVNYQGIGWRFIKDFNIRTDSDVFKMETNDYKRDTYIAANQVRCLEQVFFPLSADKIESIQKTLTLAIQYTTSSVIHIKPEGLEKLKEFLSTVKK